MSVRGKTRRTSSPDSPTVGNDSSDFGSGDVTPQVAMNSSHFVKDHSWGGVSGATEALELNRRCFSCCNLVLQLLAGTDGKERKMLLQSDFATNERMKLIMQRVSEQGYTDIDTFMTDLTKLLGKCINQEDLGGVLEALQRHVTKTGQTELRRCSKNNFQGFSRPLIEDMMSQASVVRKKASPTGLGEVNIDVGQYFARAYALGLARGSRFCGLESKEKTFTEERKKREAEYEEVVTAYRAAEETRKKEKEKEIQLKKKRHKSQCNTPTQEPRSQHQRQAQQAQQQQREEEEEEEDEEEEEETEQQYQQHKATRLQTSRRAEFSPDGALGAAAVQTGHFVRSDVLKGTSSRRSFQEYRSNKRFVVRCHHLQGQELELDDHRSLSSGHTGKLMGKHIRCKWGCAKTSTGSITEH